MHDSPSAGVVRLHPPSLASKQIFFGWLVLNLFSAIIWLGLVDVAMAGNPAYPLKLAPGQHYVVDQNGTPFFFQGDSPWSLSQLLSPADAEFYVSNRWVQGYNSLMLDFMTDALSTGTTDYWGRLPFTNTIAGRYTNLLAWNESFFTNCDAILKLCGKYGMCAVIYPLSDGYTGEDWYSQIKGNPTNALFQYGQFIGNRWKNFTNIVYVGAGDDDEPGIPTTNLWNWIAAGIFSMDTNHLMTAQAARPSPAILYSNFVNLNSTYGSNFTYIQSIANYQFVPVMPSFAREPYYENRNINGEILTALDCRHFAYWAIFSGDAGHFYGDEAQYPLTNGWQNEMWDAGATTITNVIKLVNTRPWYNCVPDASHTVVTGGYGISGTIDYITCTREATGQTLMAYIPQDQMSPTVNMQSISGTSANAWWYNPRTGTATAIGTYGTTGSQTFTPPNTNDWVLVIDNASLNLGAPGTSVINASPPSVPTNLVVTTITASSVTFSWNASTDNIGVTGYNVYRNGAQVGTSTVTNYTDTGLSASTLYSYTVSAYDGAGNVSAQSSALPVTTQNLPDTTPPTIVITTPTNYATVSGTVIISGTASDNVAVASVSLAIDGGFSTMVIGTTNWTYSLNTLSLTNGSHGVAAVATDSSGNMATNTILVVVNNDITPPTVPTNLVATAVTSSSVTLSWNASTDNIGVTGYNVYRNGAQVGTSTVTNYTDTGLSASTLYSYTVSAYDGADNISAQSSALPVTTQGNPQPPVITADLTNQTAIVGSSTNLAVTVSGSAPLSYQWFFDGTNLPGTTSNVLNFSNITPENAGGYQVVVTNFLGGTTGTVASLTVVDPNGPAISELLGNFFVGALIGTPGQVYNLQCTTNLSLSWSNLGSATVNSAGTFSFYEPLGPVPCFFRLSSP